MVVGGNPGVIQDLPGASAVAEAGEVLLVVAAEPNKNRMGVGSWVKGVVVSPGILSWELLAKGAWSAAPPADMASAGVRIVFINKKPGDAAGVRSGPRLQRIFVAYT